MQFEKLRGSYAGMAAALQLVCARHKVAIVDAGQRRNRFASASHGLLGQDGRAPGAIFEEARAQLLKYPDLHWMDGTVVGASQEQDGFAVRTAQGDILAARRLVLATGVQDQLPDVPGLRERWGRSVFHCPYCHGYELGQSEVGVLAVGELSMHQALLIPDWGRTTLFVNGAFEPNPDQLRQLAARSVGIESTRVSAVSGEGEGACVELADGRRVALAGLFVGSMIRVQGGLAEQLGCAFADSPVGAVIGTDAAKETSVPGVFACGDAARAMASVSFAIADGAMAGIAAHRSLVFDGLH